MVPLEIPFTAQLISAYMKKISYKKTKYLDLQEQISILKEEKDHILDDFMLQIQKMRSLGWQY